jgi:DNA mismatch repair protein MutH
VSDVRFDVVQALQQFRNVELATLANELGVTIEKSGKINKGWVGQTLDRLARTERVNAAAPDGVDFELKCVKGKIVSDEWLPAETFAITMLNPHQILQETFEGSALWHKIERLILVGHCYETSSRTRARMSFVQPVNVADPKLFNEIRTFWEAIRGVVARGEIATYSSKGTSKRFVQLRTKGTSDRSGTCPKTGAKFNTRAFYATKNFTRYVRGLPLER